MRARSQSQLACGQRFRHLCHVGGNVGGVEDVGGVEVIDQHAIHDDAIHHDAIHDDACLLILVVCDRIQPILLRQHFEPWQLSAFFVPWAVMPT